MSCRPPDFFDADEQHTEAPIRWGILGTGHMAEVFSTELLALPGHRVTAVGSRTQSKAQRFADTVGLRQAYGSYEALADDSELDVIYIATPNSVHYPAARLCLDAHRAILIEKPFTVSGSEAMSLTEIARRRGLFAMEGMWMRFNPIIGQARTLVSEGAIGEITALYADFGFAATYNPGDRLWAPALGGGALLDLGVYPVALAYSLLGMPEHIRALSLSAPTGVDTDTAAVLGFRSGAVAAIHVSLRATSPQTATIIGTRGRIVIDSPFFRPASLSVIRDGVVREKIGERLTGHGYTYQAEEVARCLRAGRTESPLWPLDATTSVMTVLDEIRAAATLTRR
ncbi:Gfo/Idh/MocA family protein [Nocardia brasiliensis]|uniref:Gfo/Idh/MocA family protein n=1 Tax=Nocardia brasiliensis TaxID=37326 RepID=UPI002453C44D|nr:Gfo/Idh/MocA family oxidoreductase [Nocardia brasiliensis]